MRIIFNSILFDKFKAAKLTPYSMGYGSSLIGVLNNYTDDEIYKISMMLLDFGLPFVISKESTVYLYRFGAESQELKWQAIDVNNIEMSDEEQSKFNYYKLMESV